jgi:hypothetical protein
MTAPPSGVNEKVTAAGSNGFEGATAGALKNAGLPLAKSPHSKNSFGPLGQLKASDRSYRFIRRKGTEAVGNAGLTESTSLPKDTPQPSHAARSGFPTAQSKKSNDFRTPFKATA